MTIAVAFTDQNREIFRVPTGGLVFEWYDTKDAPFAQGEVVKVAGEAMYARASFVRWNGTRWEIGWRRHDSI